jgi:hypothetical protein
MSKRNFDDSRGADKLSDQALVEGYKEGEIDGQEVMKRLLGKIGLAHRSQEVLVHQDDGSPLIGEDGRPLLAVEYMSIAEKHPPAIPTILNFIKLDGGDPRFPVAQKAMVNVVNGYLPPETSPNAISQ